LQNYFLNQVFLLHFLFVISYYKGELSLLFYLSLCTHWFYLVDHNLLLLLFILMLKFSLALAGRSPFKVAACPSDMSLSFFDHFLTSCTLRNSRLQFFFFYPNPGIIHFSKELWFVLVKSQDLYPKGPLCYWGVTTSSQFMFV
jgi:hypothetical protein